MPLSAVSDADLARADRALFVLSSYGEGEPPDAARSFARRMKSQAATMPDYAVLALGDREYPDFCAFGHQFDRWAHAGGGARLFDLIEMNGEDVDAQRQWRQQIVSLGADADAPEWVAAPFFDWRLSERRLLNPGSQGAPAFHLSLEPVDSVSPSWRAGDIVEIAPSHDPLRIGDWLVAAGLDGDALVDGRALADYLATAVLPEQTQGWTPETLAAGLRPLPHREYSIASIPEDGRIDLLVRQTARPDGGRGLGYGSGWLTAIAGVGEIIRLRIRENPGFHAPDDATPLILIGNGTGLAGLRAHLRRRAKVEQPGVWLMFGERNRARDAFHEAELEDYRAGGLLARLDYAWSRDGGEAKYVQDLLALHAEAVAAAVSDGATIMVCGSLEGMASGVDARLRAVLSDETVEAMIDAGRYRRDIY